MNVIKGIPKHVKKPKSLRAAVKNLNVDEYLQVKSLSYARNVQALMHSVTNRRYTTWKESGQSFIGRVE